MYISIGKNILWDFHIGYWNKQTFLKQTNYFTSHGVSFNYSTDFKHWS